MTPQAAKMPVLEAVPRQKNPVRQSLLGLSPVALEDIVFSSGLPKFRARQLWRWVWRHGLTNFDEMSDLGKTVRVQFSECSTPIDWL